MASRYKWYICEISTDIESLCKRLMSKKFYSEEGSWFKLVDDGNSRTMRFYWTVQVSTTSFNVNGDELPQKYSLVSYQEFTLMKIRNKVFLRLKNPGRNTNGLFNVFEKISGYGFWIEPISVIDWASSKVQNVVDSCKLTGLKVTNMAVGPKVVGRFEFASKDGIDNDLLSVYLKKPHVVDYCSYEILYKNVRGQVIFYRTGQVKISEQLAPLLIKTVEENF